MKNNTFSKKNIYLSIVAVIVFTAMFLYFLISVFSKGSNNRLLPIVTDSPLYVAASDEDRLNVEINLNEDISVSGLLLLMVNLDPNGKGTIKISVCDDQNKVLYESLVNESDIKVGDWTSVDMSLELLKNQRYQINIIPNNCSPYFMYVPESGMKTLPFGETVYLNEEIVPMNISLGLQNIVSDDAIEMVYISLLLVSVLFLIVSIFLISKENNKLANILFLLLIFVFICIDIYSKAYKNGVFISADSSGYLREAVNLKVGNGYSYDGIAGYNSWFANWPIIYPLLITVSMFITGKDAYIASKFLTVVLSFFITAVITKRYKEKANVFILVTLNIGFLTLCHYSWSEIPFMLFMLLFAFKLGDIVDEDGNIRIIDYILLGIYGILTFLTRYFGIYVWVVSGLYIFMYLVKLIKTKEKVYFIKALKLSITAFLSGIISIGYLAMNKIMNGMPSGVSRTDWWDDYTQLTKDLIDSLFTEVFNVFHINVSSLITRINYPIKTAFVLMIVVSIIVLAKKSITFFSKEAVMLTMAGCYYVMFIVIRYFSSMDTFYFRFFEPASFLLTLGLAGIVLNKLAQRDLLCRNVIGATTIIISGLVIIGIGKNLTNGLTMTNYNYYDVVKSEWNNQYREVPEKSVVIFSDLDFRSEYYRPDVVNGEILPTDSIDDLKTRYYGSEYLVIQKEYAEVMIDSNGYMEDIMIMLDNGVKDNKDAQKYISIKLN